MSAARSIESALFWLLLLAGLAAITPGLVIPAWVEREAARASLHSALVDGRQLEQELVARQRKIDMLKNDPAYLLQLAQREFGITQSGVETVMVEDVEPPPAESDMPMPEASENSWTRTATAVVEALRTRVPGGGLLFDARVQRPLMALGALLILVAVVVFGRPARRRPAAAGVGPDAARSAPIKI